MKLFFPKSHYDKSHRGAVFPLLKPFIKGKGFTDAERMAMYHTSENDFQFSETLEEADLAVLTMSWNYYVKTNQVALAVDFVTECKSKNKKVLMWNSGDFGVKTPSFDNLIIFRESGYHSKFASNEFTLPSFINDPLKKYYQTQTPFALPYTSKPLLGFCGHASLSKVKAAKELLLTVARNLKYYLGKSKNEPQALIATTHLRASVLKKLQQSELVDTLFILRDEYRAGVTKKKDTHATTMEFYDNLKNASYVVCVRGAGNFSIRFYETLAMGRIPVFINTDCALPFDDKLDWKKHVVWVEYNERHRVVEKVADFHSGLSEKDFIDLQHANRQLWEERLTLGGFFETFIYHNYTR
ncbi:exostosin domain-containing protein [Aequorivita marina]|uniref:exostosin domain-containing protein n=1 Tax=Aequorivita marina TaxID=3073654 RepID=UPI002874BE19|nr:exostosin family protein [Aequorivita sp. S2608]MDS1298040.1 exostosin family protein [Aequorivita sp. S2608]